MDATDMTPLLEQLEDDIDEVEEVLQPLLGRALSVTAQKMPVMDRAKLHVLLTYAIESLLFSYLRLNGVNAKEHPVRRELTRLKQYHDKIKALETPPEPRPMSLDKAAAGRFIKHGLAGNDKIDLARAEREAKEKAMAQLRAAQLARKLKQASQVKQAPTSTVPQKRPAEEESSTPSGDIENGNGLNPAELARNVEEMIKAEANAGSQDSDSSPLVTPTVEAVQTPQLGGKKGQVPDAEKRERKRLKRQEKKARKQQRKVAEAAALAAASSVPQTSQVSNG